MTCCAAVLGTMKLASADEPQPSYAAKAEKIESALFANPTLGDSASDADKAVKMFLEELDEGEDEAGVAKCCWIGYRCYYPTYPAYYYYGWYCPVFYCNFRMVYYTIPATCVVQTVREETATRVEITEKPADKPADKPAETNGTAAK